MEEIESIEDAFTEIQEQIDNDLEKKKYGESSLTSTKSQRQSNFQENN